MDGMNAGEKEVQEVKATPVRSEADAPEIEAKAGDGGVERTRGETFVTPDVDIYETDDALVLVADVPGVPHDGVELRTENRVLEITAHRRAGEDRRPDYGEYRPASYYRAFRLSNEIDAPKIEAELKDGVLRMTLPKAPEAKPHRIEVKPG